MSYIYGQKIGSRSTFVRQVSSGKDGIRAILKCNCGLEFEALVKSVKYTNGGCKACGFKLLGDANRKHGEPHRSKEYKLWCAIKERCYNIKCKEYSYYGGRGILMCEQWKNDFSVFLQDVGRAPTPEHSFDRFPNNDGNYEPGNWRWATKKEQARNRGNSVIVDYNGKMINLRDLADEKGVDPEQLYYRVVTAKQEINKALT